MTETAVGNAVTEPTPSAVTIRAALNFIRRQDEKPVFHSAALTGGDMKYFFETEDHTVDVADMREIAGNLSLDSQGFELRRHTTAVENLYDDDAIDRAYLPEIEELLGRRFNASRVVIFDVTRRSDSETGAENRDGQRRPATRIHNDYTAKSGPQRLKDVLGAAEAERLTAAGARIIQVNVWRPIRGPVERSPLALADASSVPENDLIATDQVFPDRVGEIYNVAHSPAQRWYYAPQMTPDEVLLIKGWDNVDDGRARFTPHSAIQVEARQDAPLRESIEVRAFVIIE